MRNMNIVTGRRWSFMICSSSRRQKSNITMWFLWILWCRRWTDWKRWEQFRLCNATTRRKYYVQAVKCYKQKTLKRNVSRLFLIAGDERIELPPKVLETPIIPFDQSPIIGCVRKTHVLLYSFIDICQELNFANCRKKIKKEAIKREKKRLCIPIYYDKINWCMNQIGVYVHNMVERFYQLP